VLVHGSGAANPTAWTDVFPALTGHFRVYTPDRRGYRASGDGPSYAIQREYEDIAAVVDAAGEPAHLLGHSFGGLCALEAALLTRNVRKLILYEPAIPLPGTPVYPPGLIDQMQALLDAGDREAALTRLYREVAMMTAEEMAAMRASPAWPTRLAVAHIFPREARAEEAYRFDAQHFKDLHTPTLLLHGSHSPASFKAVTETLAGALPNSRIAELPEQQHIAMYTAPELFLREVLAFLQEPG
jgi:pimeloyl-ACP methyl ester carboxylesterase